jgi:hypothetical protein
MIRLFFIIAMLPGGYARPASVVDSHYAEGVNRNSYFGAFSHRRYLLSSGRLIGC